jgi:hypothetical protein
MWGAQNLPYWQNYSKLNTRNLLTLAQQVSLSGFIKKRVLP